MNSSKVFQDNSRNRGTVCQQLIDFLCHDYQQVPTFKAKSSAQGGHPCVRNHALPEKGLFDLLKP